MPEFAMKKILYYNWVPFDDDENRGGGVSIYQKNLIEKILEDGEYIPYFISSGVSYSFFHQQPFIRKTKNIYKERCHTFEIVNSPIMSPGHCSFQDTRTYLTDRVLFEMLCRFIKKEGPFDVIHFNNFEGLSLNVLRLKEKFPETRIIYSLHNYYSFCPQVNLWKKESENCKNYHGGADCLNCLTEDIDREYVLFLDRLAWTLKQMGFHSKTIIFKLAFKKVWFLYRLYHYYMRARNLNPAGIKQLSYSAHDYQEYRRKNIEYVNRYVDAVLAVSERVSQIAIHMGLSPQKVFVSYIGTKFAENVLTASSVKRDSSILSLIFMGYMRRDKGFYFLLKALKTLSPEITGQMRIVVAARFSDDAAMAMLKKISGRFYEVKLYDGYTHAMLPQILAEADLGIIPVLWEDNLPQVAIEMTAHHVPILCSDLGGANELCRDERFRFKGGSIPDLTQKIEQIFYNRTLLEEFWTGFQGLQTMERHMDELNWFYHGHE